MLSQVHNFNKFTYLWPYPSHDGTSLRDARFLSFLLGFHHAAPSPIHYSFIPWAFILAHTSRWFQRLSGYHMVGKNIIVGAYDGGIHPKGSRKLRLREEEPRHKILLSFCP